MGISHCSGKQHTHTQRRVTLKMTNRLLRKEVLQSYKRCCQVANTVFKNDPDNIKFAINEKIEFALSAADVMEKYVIQVNVYKDRPTHGVAQMRSEMQFEEFQAGVGDWSGPGEGGCCGGSTSNEVEKIKRARRPQKK